MKPSKWFYKFNRNFAPPFAVVALFLLAGALAAICGCSDSRVEKRGVRLTENLTDPAEISGAREKSALTFAIASMITPDDTMDSYKKIVDYLSEATGEKIELVLRDTYAQVNQLLLDGTLDAAFICSGAYVELKEKMELDILAVPVVNGKATYRSYIIVKAGSGISGFEGLRGKSFAFTDPMSNTGRYYPLSLLKEIGESQNDFFSSVIFTHSHSASVEMTAAGMVDGAAVDNLVFNYMASENPALREKLSILQESPSYGSPPIVARAAVDPAKKNKIRKALLEMRGTPEGRAALDDLGIEGFVEIDDSVYDGIRNLLKEIGGRGGLE